MNFNIRLSGLSAVFPVLVGCFLRDADRTGVDFGVSLLDSLPIITCSGKRAGKIAPALTDKGYCSSKGLHCYGSKLHAMSFRRVERIPFPELLKLTLASENDLNAFREILKTTKDRTTFADKAYVDEELANCARDRASGIYTPVKLVKEESELLRQQKKSSR
ncbi:MAG: transposase [Bacteroidota bacterium]